MAFATSPGFPKAIIGIAKKILPADTTALVTVFTAGADGAAIQALGATSTDTVARFVSFYLTISGVDYLLGSVNVAARAGDITSVAAIAPFKTSALSPWLARDADGNSVLRLPPSAILKVAAAAAVTAAKEISIVGYGVSY